MPKVYVMMSGGVDSSVAASQLLDQGFEVLGVYMKCWSLDQIEKLAVDRDLYACNWEDDLLDARIVAERLGIPFEVWDFQDQYRQKVVDYMLSEYQKGLTPNPDVMCNSTIKFGIFFEKALSLGADFVATGHYARISKNQIYLDQKVDYSLLRGLDSFKDQSYFLWKIRPSELSRVLFPIGEFISKKEVRNYALTRDLITAAKKDSQGLCFIGKTPLRELLSQILGVKKGKIIDTKGKILGEHDGAYLYTIGQRQKLGLSGGPWFVNKIDVLNNLIIVTNQDEDPKDLYQTELWAGDTNWFTDVFKKASKFKTSAQIRYHQTAVNCSVELLEKDQIKVSFEEPVRAIAPGQSIVFYEGDLVLGGGVILP